MDDVTVLRIELEPGTEMWDKDDDRWRSELVDLRRLLEREIVDAVQPAPASPDGKGLALVPIVLCLGSAGVFTAMVETFKAWLARRPRQSSIEGRLEVDGKVMSFSFTGTNVDTSDLVALGQSAFAKGASDRE